MTGGHPETGAEPDRQPSAPSELVPVGRGGVLARLTASLDRPPAGVLLIGWDRLDEVYGVHELQVERSVVFTVTACTRVTDEIIAASTNELAVVRAPLDAPAAAEGLARRIAQRLGPELESLAVDAERSPTRWAIGVAVSRAEDEPADLLRHAEAALGDAWLLGGGRLVAFDDGDRELLDQDTDPGPGADAGPGSGPVG